mgnify:CR=1 FL=1
MNKIIEVVNVAIKKSKTFILRGIAYSLINKNINFYSIFNVHNGNKTPKANNDGRSNVWTLCERYDFLMATTATNVHT